MHLINTTDAAAEDVLVELAPHLPTEVEIGRPAVARRGDGGPELLATATDSTPIMWFVMADRVQRWMPVGDGRHELTEWAHRVELSRTLGPTE
jgi:hypothetical protein